MQLLANRNVKTIFDYLTGFCTTACSTVANNCPLANTRVYQERVWIHSRWLSNPNLGLVGELPPAGRDAGAITSPQALH